jgi:hypothetical protein
LHIACAEPAEPPTLKALTIGNVVVLLVLIAVRPPHGGVMPVTCNIVPLLAVVNVAVLNTNVVAVLELLVAVKGEPALIVYVTVYVALASNVPVKVIVALLAPVHNAVALEFVAVTVGVTSTIGSVAVLEPLIVVKPPHGGVIPVTVKVPLLLADVNVAVLNTSVVVVLDELVAVSVEPPLILYATM